jgi:RHH-type transcriptional regulator, proline utilization regulon repressor / proline dehydrogenase / delta 1-pyrroline-5-carboxylate dehydrogenase
MSISEQELSPTVTEKSLTNDTSSDKEIVVAASLDDEIKNFGKQVFAQLALRKPSFFSKSFWGEKILKWSMNRPELKRDLFRLVDVYPALESSESVADHTYQYLGAHANLFETGALNSIAEWGIASPPKSIRGKIVSYAVERGIKEMASQFIGAEDKKSTLRTLKNISQNGFAFTVDLLGEYSICEAEAEIYLQRYLTCIEVLSSKHELWKSSRPELKGHKAESQISSISVKLSALYSQSYPLNFTKSVEVLSNRLSAIVRKAKTHGYGVYVDAEDFEKREIILEVFKKVFSSAEFRNYKLPGIVLQAYARDAEDILNDIVSFAKDRGEQIAVRLVKGAYWDHETALALQSGRQSPVFSNKESSDAHFEYLSKRLLDSSQYVLPAFASHNIRSLSNACCYASQKNIAKDSFEIQMLYGMAEPIAEIFRNSGYFVRMYIPFGDLIPGMGYLVRRLLENTSNESFLKHTFADKQEVDTLLNTPLYQD